MRGFETGIRSNESSTLVILDPSLQSYAGHFLTYDKTIADEARRIGVPTIVLASKKVSSGLAGELEIVPCFRYQLEAPEADRMIALAFMSDLVEATRRLRLKEHCVFFLHTTTHRQIEPAIRFIAQEQYNSHRLIILLRYTPAPNPAYPNSQGVRDYAAALAYIDRLDVADRVRLVTDSELLAAEYSALTEKPIGIVPIPHVGGIPSAARGRTLTYLGNARGTKGFQYLPYMVSQIRPALLASDWSAEFQANVMFRRDTESVVALCQLRQEPVTLWEDELSVRDYTGLLDRSGIVLLPYQLLYYHSQTSGVLAEAIGRGKPAVVPRGTWMARQIGKGAAGVLFAPGDRVDFTRATKEAMDHADELTQRALAFRDSWVQRHNPREFIRSLLQQG